MSKAQDKRAWDAFMKQILKLKETTGGSYFEELLPWASTVSGNIGGDLPWYAGVFVTQEAYAKEMRELRDHAGDRQERLQACEYELAQCKKHDVRALRAEMARLAEESLANATRSEAIKQMLSGTVTVTDDVDHPDDGVQCPGCGIELAVDNDRGWCGDPACSAAAGKGGRE